MSDILVANESFTTTIDGQRYNVTKGKTRVRAGHPLTVRAPQYFEPVSDLVDYDIEQASKAPGEKRGERRGKPRPPKAAKAAPATDDGDE